MTSKPAALQLAATLDALGWRSVDKDVKTAAAELRRLHARVVELESAALRTPVPNVAGQTEEIHNEYGEELYVKNTGAVYQVMLAAAPRTPEPTTPDSSSIVSDEDIVRAFEGTNFGTDNHRELLHVGVLKKACQYHCGHTITTIMRDLGKAKVKSDSLLREQLASWFAAVRSLGNPEASACLQVLLLTGARPNEVRDLKWADIDWAWQGLSIRDKVEGDRIIQLTPYVASLVSALPKRNEWVFSSVGARSGQITQPNHQHEKVCKVAGIKPVTLHGLRRSFKSLTEWLDMPAGVVAQIMGHKPSATAEKHYTVRPLDLLRLHHEKIEAWVLEQGDVPFVRPEPGRRLKAV